jgi:hypothetical protein
MESPDDTPFVNKKAAKEITPAANAANGLSAESTSEKQHGKCYLRKSGIMAQTPPGSESDPGKAQFQTF